MKKIVLLAAALLAAAASFAQSEYNYQKRSPVSYTHLTLPTIA